MKPGWQTSEFWLHILGFAPTAAAVILGASNPWTLAIGAVLGVVNAAHYSWGRNSLKQSALAAATAAAAAAAEALNKPQ